MKHRIYLLLKFLFLVLIVVIGWLVIEWVKKEHSCAYPQESLYITLDGEVTDSVVRLLGWTGIRILNDPLKGEPDWPEAKIILKTRKLEEVVPAIQGKIDPAVTWLGDITKERWEDDTQKMNFSAVQAHNIINIHLRDLHQGEKIYPQSTPKAILFLGAALARVRLRLAYLNEMYNTGKISPSLPVYVLAGERKLDERIGETFDNLMDPHNGIIPFRKDWHPSQKVVTDEGEMVKLVFSQSRYPQLDERNVHFVYSHKGVQRRATAESNIKQWLADYSPKGGTYIAISNQPYNFYQESVIRRVLLQAGRPDICVKVIGPEMAIKLENESQSIMQAKNFLNNSSRILYELLEIKKSRKS
jgi:hypothetical protein